MRRLAVLLILAGLPAAALAQSQLGTDQTGQGLPAPPPPPAPSAPAAPAAPANTDNGTMTDLPAFTPPPDFTPPGTTPAAPTGAAPSGQPAAPAQTTPPPPPTPSTAGSLPPAPPNNWVPLHTAEIGVLDKVGGGNTTVSIPVGGQSTQGDLQISVLACVARPPGDLPDDAVFLSIQSTDDSAATPVFRGWMVRSVPGATVVGDASETLRIVSCS